MKFCCCLRHRSNYDKIIIHVGTNDLARAPPTTVIKVKGQANEVAVSSVVRRYDNKVKPNTITYYNNLFHQLCIDHKIANINNDCIDKPMLNRSNLHLNQKGDRVLGSAFCAFLKPRHISTSPSSLRNSHFLWKGYGRQKRDNSINTKHANRVLMN